MSKRQEVEHKFTNEEIKRLAQYMDILIQMDFEQKREHTAGDQADALDSRASFVDHNFSEQLLEAFITAPALHLFD